MRFSTLDRAQSIAGDSDADALRRVPAHAARVEALGFQRFLVAEHHGVPGIPGSQPAMLALAVAEATSAIRVGTAGIMLPNHPPLVAAEQVGVLAALYPGRIDIGVGNSVGFTQPVRDALRQGDPTELKDRFEDDLREFLAYLRGEAEVTSRPESGSVDVHVLAGFRSISLAARLGLGVIVGGPSLLVRAEHEGLAGYRRQHPSGRSLISLDIAVADTEEAARDLLLPQHVAGVLARRTGAFEALPAVDELPELTARERTRVADSLAASVYGTPAQVRARLEEITRFAGTDEVLVTGGMSDLAGQARSEELLAEMAS